MAAARHGKRVLLTEIGDPEGGYSAVGRRFGHDALGHRPTRLAPNLDACQLWAPSGHEGFLRSVLPASGPLIRAALRSKSLGKFLGAAPSFQEMGVFQHLLMLIESTLKGGAPAHEVIIVDMPATGHALALTGLPQILLRLIPGGPMAKALRAGQAWLNDASRTAAWVVALPQHLPVTESIELLEGLRETGVTPGGVLLNRDPIDPFNEAEHAALERLEASGPFRGALEWHLLRDAAAEEARLRAECGAPVWRLPELDAVPVEAALADTLYDLMAAGTAR